MIVIKKTRKKGAPEASHSRDSLVNQLVGDEQHPIGKRRMSLEKRGVALRCWTREQDALELYVDWPAVDIATLLWPKTRRAARVETLGQEGRNHT
jgi:hypothetical protein